MINQFDPKNREMLSGIQGNILKAHGRKHTANLFISGKVGKQEEVKTWIKSLVEGEDRIIKSGYEQLRSNALWKEQQVDSGIFACIHISAAGYKYLGKDVKGKFEGAFLDGMGKADLKDPNQNSWDAGMNDNAHFMLLIGAIKPEGVNQKVTDIKNEIDGFADVLFTQVGNAVLNTEGAGIEHFGYVDGVSQPLFFEDELDNYKAENGILSDSEFKFNPKADKELILIKDPFGKGDKDKGSFLVFRKLEQNVKAFKAAEKALGENLKLKGEDGERAGAMIVGRFEDGSPVQVGDEAGMIHSAVFNNFDYDKMDASKCPFHSHIRKSNPRSDIGMAASKSHIMARRGIPYGSRTDEPNDGKIYNKPTGGLGLLFMSYQASIANQFEFIQKSWVNDASFFNREAGKMIGQDPVIGQGTPRIAGSFATEWGKLNTMQPTNFEQFVLMKGGGYFFAPSMDFLKSI
jgi:Dyp-type peroxidase family